MIASGDANLLLDWQREELRSRQAIVRQELDKFGVVSPPIALQAWLPIRKPWTPAQFAAAATRRMVAVTAPDAFISSELPPPSFVRLCVGAARTHEDLTHACEVLAELMVSQPEPLDADLGMDFR